jgi:uncharacterized protein
MIEFSKQISEKWNISLELSEQLCTAYEKRDKPYYLVEYRPEIANELTNSIVWNVFDFLNGMEELSKKKKRVINALKKAQKLFPALERRVNLTINPFELDDILLPLRPNPRSKGQLAIKKGLSPLADEIMKQEENGSVEEVAEPYIGKDPSLVTTEDVIKGAKDLLAERFAYDDTVRAMAREFAYEDGFVEVTPKKKNDSHFTQYADKQIPIQEISKEEILKLMIAEDKKEIRLKLGVQLFRITELFRHHFIQNPATIWFDLLCETIDDCWMRLLQSVIERDVKSRVCEEAQQWAEQIIITDLEKNQASESTNRSAFLIANAALRKNIQLIALSDQGNLLGTTSEKKPPEGKTFVSERLKQFLNRHKPDTIIIVNNDQASVAESVLKMATSGFEQVPQITYFNSGKSDNNPAESEWMKREFDSLLDENQRKLYGIGLQYIKPLSMIPQIGSSYYSVHAFQDLLPAEKFLQIVLRIIIQTKLYVGVQIKNILDSALVQAEIIPESIAREIKNSDKMINTKNDLLKITGMTEIMFRNMAGYLVIPDSVNLLDRTLLHPDFYTWIFEISEQLAVSVDTIVRDPDILRSFNADDITKKLYLDKKIIAHLKAGAKYLTQTVPKVKRKLKLAEVQEGAIVSGTVTNITQFGVFVNINAVCDGLIHISQLADEYVENPEQVVSVNDKVDVKILKVDVKKRRISLSMKGLGNKAPKVRPTKGQLSNLAEHFKNR